MHHDTPMTPNELRVLRVGQSAAVLVPTGGRPSVVIVELSSKRGRDYSAQFDSMEGAARSWRFSQRTARIMPATPLGTAPVTLHSFYLSTAMRAKLTEAGESMTRLRIQRKRTRGWRMPADVKYVGRPTKWGNRWAVDVSDPHAADDGVPWTARVVVDKYRHHVKSKIANGELDLDELREFNGLACWCRPGEPCHADVLLELLEETD